MIELVFGYSGCMTPPPRDSADGPPVALADQLRDLAEVLEQDPADAPDETVRQLVLLLVVLIGRLEAELLGWMGVFDAKTVWAGDGSRTPGSWVGARSEVPTKRAAAMFASARLLRSCPLVDAAYRSGVIGTAKARMLLDAFERFPDLFAPQEAWLVDQVAGLTVAHAKIFITKWLATAEATRDAEARERGEDPEAPDGVPPADPAEGNALFLSRTLDGRWVGDLSLDPVSGAEEDQAIAAEIDRRFHQGTYWNGDGLSAAQRRAECHHELVMRGALAGTRHGDPRPSVSVHIDSRTLDGVPIEDSEDFSTRRCELDDGTPIARSTAERLLCGCRATYLLERLLEDGSIEIVGITDVLRDATARQRKALRERDGGCVFPGCTAPYEQCEAHHLVPFEDHGPTLVRYLRLLCEHHHHLVHEGGWTLWLHTDGELYLCKPDGTHVPMARHGHKVTQPTLDTPDSPTPPPRPPRRRAEKRFLTKRERLQREAEHPPPDEPDDRPPPPSTG